MPNSTFKAKSFEHTGGKIGLLSALIFLFGFLSSCSLDSPSEALPTLIPEEQLPTVIAMTANAMASQTAENQQIRTEIPALSTTKITPGPSLIASQTVTTTQSFIAAVPQSPTDIPSITLTPTETSTPTKTASPTSTMSPTPNYTSTPILPEEIPFAAVQIIYPSHHSKVVSPIDIYAFVAPGDDDRIRIELTGEDGRLLYRQIFIYTDTPTGARVNLKTSVAFGIPGVAETARLSVSVNDEHEQLKSLSSVDLVLLAEGTAEINPTGDLLENIIIQQPTIKTLVQGANVLVTGLARTGDDKPLLVELVAADGRIVGTRLAGIAPLQEDGGHRLFAAEVPFLVNSPTWVRVTVYDNSGRLSGPKHVSSVEVLLSP